MFLTYLLVQNILILPVHVFKLCGFSNAFFRLDDTQQYQIDWNFFMQLTLKSLESFHIFVSRRVKEYGK